MKKILLLIVIISTISVFSQTDEYKVRVKDGKYYFVNHKGKNLNTYKYTFAEDFSEGYAVVEENLKFGYIDKTFKKVIDTKYEDAGEFRNGLAFVSIGDKYGFINKKGEIVIEPQYTFAISFNKGYAIVMKENPDTTIYGNVKYIKALIDNTNTLLGNMWFSKIEDNNTGYIKNEKYEINEKGLFEKASNIEEKIDEEEHQFLIVEEPPRYKGGMEALMDFLSRNINYPIGAKENGIKGRVNIQFTINEEGNIGNIMPVEKENPLLYKESIRVLKSMPKWKPALQQGKAVKVNFVLPINFKI